MVQKSPISYGADSAHIHRAYFAPIKIFLKKAIGYPTFFVFLNIY